MYCPADDVWAGLIKEPGYQKQPKTAVFGGIGVQEPHVQPELTAAHETAAKHRYCARDLAV